MKPVVLLPGLLLCGAVAAVALGVQFVETQALGKPYLEGVVLSILLGAGLRTVWQPDERFRPGIRFSAATLLEVAVVLLGALVSLQTIRGAGLALFAAVVVVVIVALLAGYGIGRALRLPHKMAVLIAAGNAICGNSAIAAVAPAIDADPNDVASAISFTAVLGVVVVLALPVALPLLGFSERQFGLLAGLTVYAVPQVLATTAPIGMTALQTGTLVKLLRVVMLGPVVIGVSLLSRREKTAIDLRHMVPWFIVGFVVMAGLRSAGMLPDTVQHGCLAVSTFLTLLAMAALGLGVDVRALSRTGPRVALAVTGALAVLVILGLGAVYVLGT